MFQPPTANASHLLERPLQIPLAPEKKIRTFEERHIRVPRSARFAVLGSLDAPLGEVWIVCHGHGQLARRFLSRFLPLERADRLFVAPEALSRFYLSPPEGGPHAPDAPIGASWMTREDRDAEIEDYVGYLDLLHDEIFSVVDRATVRLVVLGFSQGVATAVRWVTRGRAAPDRVICYAGLLPSELDVSSAARLAARSPLLVALGSSDEFVREDVVALQATRLRELAIEHRVIRFEGGHEIVPHVLNQLAETVAG